ncbi:hypothetical protein O3M35_006972 [Rhynocoris fuscipes]|uniref:Uncharacterized protein n=1 Tax=Rhynocoris fuscipes TaxID=488301 RepID=A0AAW1DFX1_9HEMI
MDSDSSYDGTPPNIKEVTFITRLKSRTPCKEYFKELKIMTVPAIFVWGSAYYTSKCMKKSMKSGHRCIIMTLRCRSDIAGPRCRLAKVHSSFVAQSVAMFNTLPMRLRNLRKNVFKMRIRAI